MSDTQPVEFSGPIPDDGWYAIRKALLDKLHEFDLRDLQADLDGAISGNHDAVDRIYNRAKWIKYVDLLLGVRRAMEKYETEDGKLALIGQIFGDQLNFTSGQIPTDVHGRMQWLRTRVAADFERDFKQTIDRHNVSSPVEQIFLLQWRFLRLDESLGVHIQPQHTVKAGEERYTLDFAINDAPGAPIAVEIDGHEFHEKTKEQVRRDKQREREIVKLGYRMVRFSGSEVVRDVGRCCADVVALVKAERSKY